MKKPQSPLVGYNTNVRHKGKVYHIQTEDSGINHPHIITHLFADGGRIVDSRKTDYSQHLGSENLEETVRGLMKEQHKAMFIALRDSVYDTDEEVQEDTNVAKDMATDEIGQNQTREELDIDALERAAEAHFADSASVLSVKSSRSKGKKKGYKPVLPAQQERIIDADRMSQKPESIFGSDVSKEKSLDEVILGYLSEDITDSD